MLRGQAKRGGGPYVTHFNLSLKIKVIMYGTVSKK
jgi:hypothetical protein